MTYAWEPFKLATDFIRKGGLDKKQLLHDVYCHHLIMVLPHLLPIDCQDDFSKIQKYVNLPNGVEPIAGHSGVSHKISMLSASEIENCIHLINQVFEKLDIAERNV